MYDEELKRFLRDGLPAEQVSGRGTAKVTKIVGDYISNELVEQSLNEIRASMMVVKEWFYYF